MNVFKKANGRVCPVCGGALWGNQALEVTEDKIKLYDNCRQCGNEVQLVYEYKETLAFIPVGQRD